MTWLRASRRHPCPVCRKTDWCGYSEDGRLAICMRVPSDRPTRNGGHLHRLTDDPLPPVPIPPKPTKPPPRDVLSFCNILKQPSSLSALQELAKALGVSVAALTDLQAVWLESHNAWAFPMRGGDGKVIGIRLRAMDARKWSIRGSREGLFYAERIPDDRTAVICEGPTDTAAAITMGLWAVGRPSCMGGIEHLKALARRFRLQYAVIVGDNDPPKPRPQGGYWQPGLEGARRLMSSLKLPCKLLIPPAKDIRAWLQAGAIRDDFEALAKQQDWRHT